jgi:hypothetical protein
MTHKLGEESVLKVRYRRPVDSGDLEVTVVSIGGVDDVDVGIEAESSGNHICDSNNGVVPKQNDSTPRSDRRPCGEALQTVTSNVGSIGW